MEAKLLNRNAVGVDINPRAISLSKKNLKFSYETNSKIYLRTESATNLSFLKTENIDFICTHPPYANIIKYSEGIENDLSILSAEGFLEQMKMVASESFRILRRGKYCAIMMGDIRKKGNVIPLGFQVMEIFLEKGFNLKEIIIKEQHNCRMSEKWMKVDRDFLLLAHEYIFVFYK